MTNLNKGFTLAEILVALGILAVGMSMVAAIFPAAMEYNRDSTNKTLGAIICENGLIVSELALTAEVVDGLAPTLMTVFADDANFKYISQKQQRYPTEGDPSKTGFAMMVRSMAPEGLPDTERVYQIITVAYRKTNKDNTVVLVPLTCDVNTNIIKNASTKLKIGSPLINRTTGEFAFIDSVSVLGTDGTLDIDASKRNLSGGENKYYILVERTAGGGVIDTLRRSPAIEAMSKITGLRRNLVIAN